MEWLWTKVTRGSLNNWKNYTHPPSIWPKRQRRENGCFGYADILTRIIPAMCFQKKPSFGKQIVRNIFSFWRKQRNPRLIRRGFAVHPVGGGLWLVQSQAWPSAAEHDCRCRAADCLHRSRHILSDLFQQEPLAGRCVRVYFYRVRRSGLDSAAAKRLFEQLFALFHDCRGCHRRGVY